jgi:hypothetical protein
MTKKWPLFWCVVVVVFACFAPALGNGLLDWDDSGYILDNPHIRTLSLETVRWAFTETWCNYWAPLTWLSLALDYAIWGLDPFGYHLTSVLLHAIGTGLFFLASVRLLQVQAATSAGGTSRSPGAVLACAALAALLYGIHPLRVESVAWAAERKDVLSVLLGLGAILAYLRYAGDAAAGPNPGHPAAFARSPRYWVVMVLYGASLLAKATLVTLPFLLLVLDWFPLRRLARGRLLGIVVEKLPMLVLAVSASLVTMRAMAPTSKSLEEVDLATRALTAFTSTARYLWLMVAPLDISPVYFHPGAVSLGVFQAFSIGLVGALTAGALATARQRPVLLVAWLSFLVLLSPVLGLAQNGNQELAPRFTYAASLPLSLLAALGITTAWRTLGRSKAAGVFVGIAVTALLAGLAALTVRDIGHWKDDVSLWSRVIELQPHRFGKAYAQRALFLGRKGEYRAALSDLDEALAIARRKRYGAIHEIYAQRGRARQRMGDLEGAVIDFNLAIEVADDRHRAMYLAERAAAVQGLSGPAAAGPGAARAGGR